MDEYRDVNYQAGEDLSNWKYHLVAIDKDSGKVRRTKPGDTVGFCVLRNAPATGEEALVRMFGRAIPLKENIGSASDKTIQGDAGKQILLLIQKKMYADKDLTYGAAFNCVQEENPRLAKQYADSL